MKTFAGFGALLADDSGGMIVEYALALAALSGAAIAMLAGLGQAATDSLGSESSALTQAGRQTPGGPSL